MCFCVCWSLLSFTKMGSWGFPCRRSGAPLYRASTKMEPVFSVTKEININGHTELMGHTLITVIRLSLTCYYVVGEKVERKTGDLICGFLEELQVIINI